MERFPKIVNNAFNRASTRPEFESERPAPTPEEEKYDVTVTDLFGVPSDKTVNLKTFVTWFEPRFGNIQTQEDLEKISSVVWDAARTIQAKPYLLAPREGGELGLPNKVKKDLKIKDDLTLQEEKENSRKIFKAPEDVLAFFRKVSVDIGANPKAMLSPDRNTKVGAEKLAVCRILNIAYILECIRNNQDFRDFFKNARSVICMETESGADQLERFSRESGIFPLITKDKITILDDPDNEFNLIEWLEKGEVLRHCQIIMDGKAYFIPEVRIGVKGGIRALLKMARKPKAEILGALDDFFRMTFVFDNETNTEEIINFLESVQKDAKRKTNPQVTVEYRAKNYFSPEDLERYFPKVLKKTKDNTSLEKDADENSLEGEDVVSFRKGRLDKIKLDQNPASGKNFKNISMKVELRKPSTEEKNPQKPYFSFEVQVLRKFEFERNESLKDSAAHFYTEMRQFLEYVSRIIGKASEKDFIKVIKEYLSREVKTDKMPAVLRSEKKVDLPTPLAKNGGNERLAFKERFEINFVGTLEEKAKKLFDFLLEEGILRRTTANFPQKEMPTARQKESSAFYIHSSQMEKMLGLINAETIRKPKIVQKKGPVKI